MEKTTLTSEELVQIQKLNSDYNSLILAVGQLHVQKHLISEQMKGIDEQLTYNFSTIDKLKKVEAELGEALTAKYGDGNIDLESGVFTPVLPK